MRIYEAFPVGVVMLFKLMFYFYWMRFWVRGLWFAKTGRQLLCYGKKLNKRDCSYNNSRIFSSYICHAACCRDMLRVVSENQSVYGRDCDVDLMVGGFQEEL